jgi:hypothetical protein
LLRQLQTVKARTDDEIAASRDRVELAGVAADKLNVNYSHETAVSDGGTAADVRRVPTVVERFRQTVELPVDRYQAPKVSFKPFLAVHELMKQVGGGGSRHSLVGELSVTGSSLTDVPIADKSKISREPRVIQKLIGDEQINGLALLDNELFVLRQRYIAVYDVTSDLDVPRCYRAVQGLNAGGDQRNDIASCVHHRCLYVSDYAGRCIHRLDVTQRGRQQDDDSRWPVGDAPSGLSVTADRRVLLVAFPEARKLVEFATYGKRLREIRLPDGRGQSVDSPWHAIQLPPSSNMGKNRRQIVVSHGWSRDAMHRVVVISVDNNNNSNGHVTQSSSYGGLPGSAAVGQLNWPRHLAVDTDGCVFISDCCNHRVLLLSATLSYLRDVVSRDDGDLPLPRRLCLDIERRRLYVGQEGGILTVVQL